MSRKEKSANAKNKELARNWVITPHRPLQDRPSPVTEKTNNGGIVTRTVKYCDSKCGAENQAIAETITKSDSAKTYLQDKTRELTNLRISEK